MPGVREPVEPRKPVATLLESAKRAGKATGVVATSRISHASPAAFTAHYYMRDDYETLAEQQVSLAPDVMLGGGLKYLESKGRADGQDLIATLRRPLRLRR
jgi:alkaline phosphatase